MPERDSRADGWPPAPEGALITMFAVYDRPLDFPDNWVVRRWFLMEGVPEPVMDVVPRLADVLDQARRLVPPGFVKVVSPGDDPFLFESWV